MPKPTLEGKLDDFSLGDIVQFLALGRRTGRIDLSRRDERGLVVLREGRLLYAVSGAAKETLGHMLTARGLVAPDDLDRALERHRAEPQGHLGTVLVELGLIDQSTLEELITEQLDQVLEDLLRWRGGVFGFTPLTLDRHGEVEVEASDLRLDEGVSAERVLLRISSREDEAGERERRAAEPSRGAQGGEVVPEAPQVATLREIIEEIRSPMFTSETTLRIMEHARRRVDRGVFFAVRLGGFGGIGQFGIELDGDASPDEVIRDLRVPLEGASILAECADRQRPYRSQVPESRWDRRLLDALGGGDAREAAAIPLVVDGRVLLVLYLDNWPSGGALPPLEPLELLVLEAGRKMETDLLRKRLDDYEKLRGLGEEREGGR